VFFISDFGHDVFQLRGASSGGRRVASGELQVRGCPMIFICDFGHYVFQLRGERIALDEL